MRKFNLYVREKFFDSVYAALMGRIYYEFISVVEYI